MFCLVILQFRQLKPESTAPCTEVGLSRVTYFSQWDVGGVMTVPSTELKGTTYFHLYSG